MADSTQKTDFTIADSIQNEHPKLIELILWTESMDSGEKQYWFDILPSMTPEQVQKLYNILETEKQKLDELENKYQQEIEQLNDKHIIDNQSIQAAESRRKIQEKEQSDKKNNTKKADDILEDW